MPAGLFPEKLRALRQTHQLTQAELARLLGLAKQGYISNLEAGRKTPSLELVVRIADVFGVSTDYLLDNSPVEYRSSLDRTISAPPSVASPPRLFGAKLRYLRLKYQLSQADLAHQLGLTRQGYVSNMEIGHRDPSLDMVIRVANRFGVSVDYLLRDTIAVEMNDMGSF